MTTSKLDARQHDTHNPLDQLTTTSNAIGDALLRSTDRECTPPLVLQAVGTTGSMVVAIGAVSVSNPVADGGSDRKHAQPHILNSLPAGFTGGTVTFPSAGTGSIVFSAGDPLPISVSTNRYLPIVVFLRGDGTIGATGGIEGTGATGTTMPMIARWVIPVGHIMLHRGATGLDPVTNSAITQFLGGDNWTGTIADHDLLADNGGTGSHAVAALHMTGATGVHGLTGSSAVVGTSTAQTLTNKVVGGGAASNSNRITLPGDTKAVLDGLDRVAGTLLYGADTAQPYFDGGTNPLRSFSSDITIVDGTLTDNYGEFALTANQILTVTDTRPEDNTVASVPAYISTVYLNSTADSENTVSAKNNSALLLTQSQTAYPTTAEVVILDPAENIDVTIKRAANTTARRITWYSAGDMTVPRFQFASAGTSLAAIVLGATGGAESFNGTSWSAVSPAATIARSSGSGCGTMNAAVMLGGTDATPEIWNGAAWTTMIDLPATKTLGNACGSVGAILYFNGGNTYSFSGGSWTTKANPAIARTDAGSAGIPNAAFTFGGNAGGTVYTAHEKWNGYNWSIANIAGLTARTYLSGSGLENAALSIGGSPSTAWSSCTNTVERFNGQWWILEESTQVPAGGTQSRGTAQNTMSCGGSIDGSAGMTRTERSMPVYPWITGIWSTVGASTLTTRYSLAGCGIQSAALSFGGYTGVLPFSTTQKFNGVVWAADSSGGTLTTRSSLAGCGTQNAALSFGGTSGAVVLAATQKFNGATWAADGSGGTLTARYGLAGCGTQLAALSFGGTSGVLPFSTTQKFNGTVWAADGSSNTLIARQFLAGCGITNAALSFGGQTAGGGYSFVTQKFNGTVWAANGSGGTLTVRLGLAGCGTQNAALSFGGMSGSFSTVTEKFNGTTWSANSNLAVARYVLAGCGSQQTALSFGGRIASGDSTSITEQYTAIMQPNRFYYSIV